MIERFRHYLLVDHRTRWRNDLSCAALSLGLYLAVVSSGIGDDTAFKMSMALLLLGVSGTTLWYCLTPHIANARQSTPQLTSERVLSRRTALRTLLRQAVAAGTLLILAKFTTPSLEAAIVDTRLRRAVRGEPTLDKIRAATQIAKEAREHNVHVSPEVISEVGQKIVGSAAAGDMRKEVLVAANQFASYRSSLSPLPLNVKVIQTLTATPESHKEAPISITIGCAEGKTGGQARLLGIFEFAGLTVDNCSDVVVWPAKPEILKLDNVEGKNATFVNCILIYDGGKLILDNVRFVNCEFRISAPYTANQNVLRLLSAALSGEPIHLDITA